MVHYVFWLFSGGAPASQPATGRGGGFQSLNKQQQNVVESLAPAAPKVEWFIEVLKAQKEPKKQSVAMWSCLETFLMKIKSMPKREVVCVSLS